MYKLCNVEFCHLFLISGSNTRCNLVNLLIRRYIYFSSGLLGFQITISDSFLTLGEYTLPSRTRKNSETMPLSFMRIPVIVAMIREFLFAAVFTWTRVNVKGCSPGADYKLSTESCGSTR